MSLTDQVEFARFDELLPVDGVLSRVYGYCEHSVRTTRSGIKCCARRLALLRTLLQDFMHLVFIVHHHLL